MRPTALGLLRVAYVVVAALLTATLPSRLGVPTSWMPDLVLIGVVATAVIRGPVHGALVGLAAGWVVELVPPVSRPLGLVALAMALAGAAAGAVGATSLRSALRAMLGLVAAALVVLASGIVAQASVWGAAQVSDVPTRLVATTAAGIVLLPTLTVVDRALVRRRLA